MNLTFMICYTNFKVLNVNILILTLQSAFNVAIYVAVFTTSFKWEIQIFPVYAVYMPF